MLETDRLIIRQFGVLPYQPVWSAMKQFAADKTLKPDELWILQHEPVYTRGIRCKEQPLPQGQCIPVVAVDRGGLMTYHGPGQLIVYCLINLQRKKLNIKQIVYLLEQVVINVLDRFSIEANRIEGAPGIYLGDKKIASIGLRVRNQTSYHGLSINFDMDLKPFDWINPCGFEALEVVQLKDLITGFDWQAMQLTVINELIQLFEYEQTSFIDHDDFAASLVRNNSSLSSVPTSIQSPS